MLVSLDAVSIDLLSGENITAPRAMPAKSTTTNITINMLSFRF